MRPPVQIRPPRPVRIPRWSMPTVRYLVGHVDAAGGFYTPDLGFELERRMGPPFAIVRRGDLRLWLSGPESSASRPIADGRRPEPGGGEWGGVEGGDPQHAG